MAVSKAVEDVKIPPKDEEELLLEKLVFGDAEGFEANLKKVDNLFDDYDEDEDADTDGHLSGSDEEDEGLDGVQDEDLFFIDDGNADAMEIDQADGDEVANVDDDEDDSDSDNAVWDDSDDEKVSISLLASDRIKKLRKYESDSVINGNAYAKRLRSQFEKIYPRPEWIKKLEDSLEEEDGEDASDDKDGDSDSEMEGGDDADEDMSSSTGDSNAILQILSSSHSFIITKQLKLIAPNRISITRLKNANQAKVSKGAIQSLSFHHSHPLLMTGGFDRTLRIFHIDGKHNNLVTSLHLRNSPITTCAFAPASKSSNQNLIFAGGRRRYMNKWDLNSGEVEKISRMYGHEQTQRSFEYFKISPRGKYIGLTGSSGWCNILNGETGQWIKGFKIEGTIIDFEFAHDESFIVIINTAGEVWEYPLTNNKITNNNNNNNNKKHNDKEVYEKSVIRRWQDHAGVGITKIKLEVQRVVG